MDGGCSKKNCPNIGIYWVYLELYPNKGSYHGGPAHLYFPDLKFCEEHAKELRWDALIYPDVIAGMFEQLGKPMPDFNRTGLRLEVVHSSEVV